MKRLRPWVKLPNAWIEANGLRQFRWKNGQGAANESALIALAVIAHHSDTDTGVTRMTYNELTERASLSRAMVSAGLSVLDEKKLLIREPEGRSTYALAGFNPAADWAKLPAAPLYQNGAMAAFSEFQKRKAVELDAMKLYCKHRVFDRRHRPCSSAGSRRRAAGAPSLRNRVLENLRSVRRERLWPSGLDIRVRHPVVSNRL